MRVLNPPSTAFVALCCLGVSWSIDCDRRTLGQQGRCWAWVTGQRQCLKAKNKLKNKGQSGLGATPATPCCAWPCALSRSRGRVPIKGIWGSGCRGGGRTAREGPVPTQGTPASPDRSGGVETAATPGGWEPDPRTRRQGGGADNVPTPVTKDSQGLCKMGTGLLSPALLGTLPAWALATHTG